MELKQPGAENRIIFLKKFTEELIISFLEEEQIKKRIEVEKLRREFIEPQISTEQAFKKIIRTPVIPIKVTEKNGKVIGIKSVNENDDIMIITDKGQVIRMNVKGISIIGRNTQGVSLQAV